MSEANRTMTIAHVSWRMGIGGAERALFQLMRAQRDFGHRVKLIVVSHKGFYAEEVEKEGIEVVALNLSLLNFVTGLSGLKKLFASTEVVHFHSTQPLLMAMSALQPVPRYYFTMRGGRLDLPLKRRMSYQVTRFYLRNFFSGVSGNTSFAAQCAEQRFGLPEGAAFTTYNGIDFDLLQPKRESTDVREELRIPSSAVVIGTSANLKAWKRTEKLLTAFAGLANDLHLCIIGDGGRRNFLENLAAELGIAERCHFTGMQENVSDYLQILDIFALPSDANESFGNSVVEAMGMGIPSVVMFDSPGIVEHMQFEGGLVAQNDEELSTILKSLVESKSYREQIGTQSSPYVRGKYTYQKAVLAYNKLYESTDYQSAASNR